MDNQPQPQETQEYPPVPFKEVRIKTVDHKDQRYETCGDYEDMGEYFEIRVSKTTPHQDFLIGLHEFIELYLINSKGVKIEDIDTFDRHFEDMRNQFPDLVKDSEPGNHDSAPYRKEHGIASRVEEWLANVLHVDMNVYNESISKLSKQ